MRKIKLYIAMSLNGLIAGKNGEVDWLENIPNPEQSDYGYHQFYDSIDATIQGRTTYQQIVDWGIDFPYTGKKNYVLTRNTNLQSNNEVTFITEKHIDFIKNLKQQAGGDIWLIGGGQVNTMLLNAGLIDELQIFIMPILLTEGITLFEALPKKTPLQQTSLQHYSSGVVEIHYKIINEQLA